MGGVRQPPDDAAVKRQPQGRVDAVIFDLDGVITDTASAHAAAWKQLFDTFLQKHAEDHGGEFVPFNVDTEYRAYVDGIPRYDGVRKFLASRGITLPLGEASDGPEATTIHGLGNRKNGYFSAWLAENHVRIYPATLRLLHMLRAAGVKTGVFSASRNASAVLANAGIANLFDAKVDGLEQQRLGLAGKPDPATLLELAARLKADPSRTAVVEDAILGVTAGAAGGFSCVIGIDRDDNAEALAAHGATIVVGDLGELDFAADSGFVPKTLSSVPSVWSREAELHERFAGKELAVFLDYDGTMTPIVVDYTKAFLPDSMRETVAALAERCTVGIISGRDLDRLKELVGINDVIYAGSHGFDIEAPGRLRDVQQKGQSYLADLDAAEIELTTGLDGVAGHAIERKRFAIAVHYRRVADADVASVERVVDDVLDRHPNLRKGHGKKVFEVQPRMDWNKGQALNWLLVRLGLARDDVLPIYIGDDLTDEDAFHALALSGIGIVVGEGDRQTAADYSLASPNEVERFLDLLRKVIDGDS